MLYIFAVALQDGAWHHDRSYAPERAHRPDTVELWHKITTGRGPGVDPALPLHDPAEKAFGGRVEITLTSGEVIVDEIAVADAHPWAPGRSSASSTSASSPSWPTAWSTDAEQQRFLSVVEALSGPAGRRIWVR